MFGYSHTGLSAKVEPSTAAPLRYSQQVAIENTQKEKYTYIARPTCGVSGNSWEFVFPAQGDDSYLNMRDMRVHVEAKVTNANGTAVTSGNVAPVCNFAQSLFPIVESRLNDRTLPGGTFNDAHYKGYLNAIMRGSIGCKNMYQLQGFYPDTEGKFEDVGNTDNKGFVSRKALATGSRTFAFSAPIMCDILNSNNYLGPGNKLSIRLVRASDEQILMAQDTATYKLKIVDIFVECTRVIADVLPPPQEIHYFPQTEILKFPMAADTTNINLRVQAAEKMPRHLLLFFVKTHGANGSYKSNMFEFQNLHLTSLNLRTNGRSYPSEPLKPDFENGKVTREMMHMFQNMGYDWGGKTGLIDRAKFINGYTIFPFDLSADKCDGTHIHDLPEGVIEIEATCKNMDVATTAFVLMTWDIEFTIQRQAGAPYTYTLAYLSAPKRAP